MKKTILVVDDEEDIVELISYNLKKVGYNVLTASSGEECISKTKTESPDLIVLDLMLPGIDGLDVCKKLKSDKRTEGIPIIMLSAKGEEADVVSGLELGADDYLSKPFSPRVLLARIKTVVRRSQAVNEFEEKGSLKIEKLQIDIPRHEVSLDGSKLDLTHTEFKLLYFLAKQRGFVFTRSQIVDGVHGDDYPVTDRSIDVQIVGLRKKLGAFGVNIETVRGVGYRFKE